MDEYTIKLDDETELFCSLYLFVNVENSDEIRKKLMSGELHCCIIKAPLVVDPFHVIAAANKAVLNEKSNRLTTKSIFTEILFCLSLSKNISRSLLEFGIDKKDKNILVAIIYKDEEEKIMRKTSLQCIKGQSVAISKISEFTDLPLIRNTYKIDNEEALVSSITNSIVSRISIKDFASLK